MKRNLKRLSSGSPTDHATHPQGGSFSSPQLFATGLGLLILGGAVWWQRNSAEHGEGSADRVTQSTSAKPRMRRELPQTTDSQSIEPLVSTDDLFLHRVRDSIEAGMGSSSFSVDTLAHQVGMSRVHLYRRLQALIAQTPSGLIRSLRLERAEKLLRAHAGSVSQIAYRVGFKSASHFSQSFRMRYRQPPSTYRHTKAHGALGRPS
jgi:transcriptional regulator GlxA family with amidase domain